MSYFMAVDEHDLVLQSESKTREYKQDLSSPEKAMRAIVAFANSAGGQLVIGVADDGKVVGVDDPLLQQERLTNLISDWVSPQLMPTIELVPLAGVTVVVADVAVSIRRPHFLTKYGKEEGTYIRLAASNRRAGPDTIAELERSAEGVHFDQFPAFRATMDDLDLPMLADMLGRDVDERTLKTLELVVDDQGYLNPTNAGVLVACPHPERFFSFAYVQCARFRGPTKRDIWDQEEIYGPLPLAVDKVMRFLERNAFKHAEFGDIYRKDVWSIPISPLREIVTNALVHASYSTQGTAIKVAFLDQTIEIESPGGLMPHLTIEDMVQGVSVIRNPAIARVFLEMGLIEKWGTGLPRAIQALTEAGLPAPEFKELPISLRVIVHIKNHDVTPRTSSPEDVVTDVVTNVARDVTVGLTSSERSILSILRSQGSVPARELASQTGLSDRQAQRILVRLADQGFIAREGSTRYGKWVILDTGGGKHATRVGD